MRHSAHQGGIAAAQRHNNSIITNRGSGDFNLSRRLEPRRPKSITNFGYRNNNFVQRVLARTQCSNYSSTRLDGMVTSIRAVSSSYLIPGPIEPTFLIGRQKPFFFNPPLRNFYLIVFSPKAHFRLKNELPSILRKIKIVWTIGNTFSSFSVRISFSELINTRTT